MRKVLAALCFVLGMVSAPVSVFAEVDLGAVTQGMIERHIVPAYATLSGAADAQETSVAALCAAPSADALGASRMRFADLVEAWSAVEFIRFGPAREDNRYERLFFWPDRNGRGLGQVQRAIASADPSVTDVTSLQGKSVALQGLLALDYVLFGTGSDGLADPGLTDPGSESGHRCAFAQAISGAVAATAAKLADGWTGPDSYAALMLLPGPDNPIYRSEGEALQELLRAMAEQLQIMHDAKLIRVVGTAPGDARARRAPFWRSGQSLASMIANAEAMASLNEAGDFATQLPEQARRYAGTLRFELSQITRQLTALRDSGADLETLVTSDDTHGRLAAVALPLAGAMRVVGEVYPAQLGLTMGFNSLDGD